jgi:hypothetical protein
MTVIRWQELSHWLALWCAGLHVDTLELLLVARTGNHDCKAVFMLILLLLLLFSYHRFPPLVLLLLSQW